MSWWFAPLKHHLDLMYRHLVCDRTSCGIGDLKEQMANDDDDDDDTTTYITVTA
jgi:hypothetical protein